ncbi:MAG: SDR family NAD(P)-dependent oxidoreductase, partial [Kiritimatiellae bacterium]|nr:SDR family NAD(P)-dependent oxidoreductase [Kiritimatiellia bacterium]
MKYDICSFENRVAVVTGAGGNIGLAVCRQLAGYGVRIAACDVDAKIVEERIADLKAAGADIRAYSMDVLSRKAVFDAIAAILSDFGKIDIMINNAGVWNHRDVIGRQRFEEMDPVEWKRLLEIDLDGVFHCCQAILPHM